MAVFEIAAKAKGLLKLGEDSWLSDIKLAAIYRDISMIAGVDS
jgi:hypothetical protein